MLALPALPFGQPQVGRENALKLRLAADLSRQIAAHPAEISADRPQAAVGALELFGVDVALVGDQGVLADPRIRLPKRHAVRLGEPHQRLRARCMTLASVGNATAFGCTVVSRMTRLKSEGLAAPVRVAVARLS